MTRATPAAGGQLECPVARAARLRPSAIALEQAGRTLTYAALDARVRAWQARLQALGAHEGARVAVLSDGSVELVALLHAAARARVTLALLNTRLAPMELAALAGEVSPAVRLCAEGLALEGAHPLTAGDEGVEPGLAQERRFIDPAHVQALMFTSGTTGRAKAAQLTAGALQASARAANEVLGIDAPSRLLCCLPLFHVGGLGLALRAALAGATLVLHARFEARAVARALAQQGITHTSLVATTLSRVLDEQLPAPSLRAALIGGGPVPAALLERARAAGFPVLQTYGLTETCSQATCERPGQADGATSGPPMPGTEVRIVEGEIQVRGPTLMRGYAGAPDLPQGAWLRTGDLGELDGRGRLVVHARRTDLILSGGENVYPAEVEAALLSHPLVGECAVLPAPDAEYGQVPLAALVLQAPLEPGAPSPRAGAAESVATSARDALERELIAWCRARLAGYKVPRRYALLEALPRTAAGKVDRPALRALLGL